MNKITKRLLAALQTIHDHLHHERYNEAHEACEMALCEKEITPTNLYLDDAAKLQVFAQSFNELCQKYQIAACFVAIMPSKTDPQKSSIQSGGHVEVVRYVEGMMFGKKSKFMGEHS